jgi:hypothetical protein
MHTMQRPQSRINIRNEKLKILTSKNRNPEKILDYVELAVIWRAILKQQKITYTCNVGTSTEQTPCIKGRH